MKRNTEPVDSRLPATKKERSRFAEIYRRAADTVLGPVAFCCIEIMEATKDRYVKDGPEVSLFQNIHEADNELSYIWWTKEERGPASQSERSMLLLLTAEYVENP